MINEPDQALRAESEEKIWKVKEDYSFDINRIAAALLWEKSCREEAAREIDTKITRARLEGINCWQLEFVQQVMDYEEGCEEGKHRFIRYMGCEPPEIEYRISFVITASGDIDIHDVCNDIESRLVEHLDEGNKISDISSPDFNRTD